MSNVTIILSAVIAAVMRDYQQVLPALCGRISKATAGALDRNVCLDGCASSVPLTLSCVLWAWGTLLFLLQVHWFFTAAASRASVLEHLCGILMWSAGNKIPIPCFLVFVKSSSS